MARKTRSNFHIGYMMLSALIAFFLWGIAHTASSIERGYDIPLVFDKVPDDLVITDQNADVVNVRVAGSRASLRDLSPTKTEYGVDVSGARPGSFVHEVDASRIELPRGTNVVSRSPSIIELRFERKGRKRVKIRPDVDGKPGNAFELVSVDVEPPKVWLAGARSDVLRLSEVVTETVDIAGLTESTEREVRLSLGGGHVWMDEQTPVKVRIQIQPRPAPEAEDRAAQEKQG